MLSERDRRALTGIETELAVSSPRLAHRMRNPARARAVIWAPPVTLAVLGFALAVLMLALALPGQAFVVLLVFAWPLARRARLRLRRRIRRTRVRFPGPQV